MWTPTNSKYTFVEPDLSQNSVQTFALIAFSICYIGTVTVTEGNMTVDYDLCTNEIVVYDEMLRNERVR